MTAYMQGCKTMEKAPYPFSFQKGLSRDMSWPSLFVVSYFLWCCLMHLIARIMESTFDTALSALSQKTSSKDQGENWYRQRVSVHRWRRTERFYQSQHAKRCWRVLIGLWQFWPNRQHNKKEVMYQPALGKPYVDSNITLKGHRLKLVEKFTYLSSTRSKSIVIDDEVNTRLEKAMCSLWPTQQEYVESGRHLGGKQNQVIPSCRSYNSP